MLGVRPYKYLGAEIGYIDFGTARRSQLPDGVGNFTNLVQATTKATAVELVGYLPIIPSRWDVFAKAGQGRQSSDFYSYGYYPNVCVGTGSTCAPLGNASLSYSSKQTGFIYGIGTQYQFGKFGLRAEYQSFGGSQPPSMFAIGALWKF